MTPERYEARLRVMRDALPGFFAADGERAEYLARILATGHDAAIKSVVHVVLGMVAIFEAMYPDSEQPLAVRTEVATAQRLAEEMDP